MTVILIIIGLAILTVIEFSIYEFGICKGQEEAYQNVIDDLNDLYDRNRYERWRQ